MKQVRTHTFTGRVSAPAHARLEDCLEQQRQLYNAALQERRDAYRKTGKSPSYTDQAKSLTIIRGDDKAFEQYPAQLQQYTLRRVDLAYQSFFRRCKEGKTPGYPRFKSKSRFRSVEIPMQSLRIHTTENGVHSIKIKGIGRIRFVGELPKGAYKRVRIVKTPKRIKVQFVVEELPKEIAEDDREPIGIDLGVKAQVTLSNGWQLPRNIVDDKRKKRLQRKLSKAQPGSKLRAKKRQAYAKECQAVAEREHGKMHELTTDIIKHHGTKIYVEGLSPERMTRKSKNAGKRGLNREIRNQQWGKLVDMLTYKAESAGGWVRKVPPHGTTQTCSSCGREPDVRITLGKRWYDCTHCGHQDDRDLNAAINVRQKGINAWKSGGNSPTRGTDVLVSRTN